MAYRAVALNPPEKGRRAFLGLVCAAPLLIQACSKRPSTGPRDFVGKWRSSRMENAPIHLHENGEWEVTKEDGTVLQYGVWQYKDDAILWSHKSEHRVIHETNVILSVAPREFRLRERDGSTTTFVKLD